jgi:branched-chain amino acid transport system ATP-binding protein
METLRVEHVVKSFGGLRAISDVSLEVRAGEILGLIGPNGAGKSTLINCISGVYKPNSGRIWLGKRDITGRSPHAVCRAGIARTFQIPRPFPRLTARENVQVASFRRGDDALDALGRVGLAAKADVLARDLTFHERRKLEIARALAARPRFLLLDEVMAGLNPTETAEMVDLVRHLRQELGLSMLWVEHVMGAIMECADRLVVLHQGSLLAEGSPREIANNPQVIEVYLGERYAFKEERVAACDEPERGL